MLEQHFTIKQHLLHYFSCICFPSNSVPCRFFVTVWYKVINILICFYYYYFIKLFSIRLSFEAGYLPPMVLISYWYEVLHSGIVPNRKWRYRAIPSVWRCWHKLWRRTRMCCACLQAEESTCMRHGTFVNACRSLTWKKINCWNIFYLIDKVILVFFVLFNITVWTTDVTWTILTMSFYISGP